MRPKRLSYYSDAATCLLRPSSAAPLGVPKVFKMKKGSLVPVLCLCHERHLPGCLVHIQSRCRHDSRPESWIERCLSESENKRYSSHTSLGNVSNDENEEKENNRASKPHSTPATLQWLEENYEIAEGVCIPRSALYMHYLDFCEKNDTQPVNAASFGKKLVSVRYLLSLILALLLADEVPGDKSGCPL
ncbi:hypothetical protein A6R68_04818 [Neotoma lepida]|uniref:RFX-type winged-helix domain-containing protein n=1 Tax=Neotoma lepida TaxID=56216 RepID=A0A1A6GLP4_NEOLE|nr:hypothetical protein A6R68_04818 [Neotoma lepida]